MQAELTSILKISDDDLKHSGLQSFGTSSSGTLMNSTFRKLDQFSSSGEMVAGTYSVGSSDWF
jgi:hypothetical protein